MRSAAAGNRTRSARPAPPRSGRARRASADAPGCRGARCAADAGLACSALYRLPGNAQCSRAAGRSCVVRAQRPIVRHRAEPVCQTRATRHRGRAPRQDLQERGRGRRHLVRPRRRLDLLELLDRPTGKLSAGQKTRVSLAKALINRPEILLLDEPTASLDPDTADWVRGRIERYRRERGATILLASHNMAEVERLCERVIIMKKGRIEDDDTPRALLQRYGRHTLEEVFLDVARGRMEARDAAR